ncbi:MAG: type II secretion system protein [Candidatus Aminicenantes bacterium]|nr:type II secretion system protein [Candidatus Aminicenantes bacterium]
MKKRKGYMLIILMMAVFVLSIGLLVAVPVWETQIQREKEEELIFRGKQFVEAVRLYQLKNPGTFPKSFDELIEERCLRKLFKDPMSEQGEWNVILPSLGVARAKKGSPQKVLVVPYGAFPSIENPQIIGVVSSSTKKSIKIYHGQENYDTWLFYYGQDPEKMPEIVYYGEEEKD